MKVVNISPTIETVDNFLEPDEFEQIRALMTSDMFPWYYNDHIIREGLQVSETLECDVKNNWQFIHLFYSDHKINSPHFDILRPIITKIDLKALVRIKANCVATTEKSVRHGSHVDFYYKRCFTSIFYVNTNNGFTQFKTGEKVGSVANRLITFPSPTYHSGVSCTDKQVRMVINFNYF